MTKPKGEDARAEMIERAQAWLAARDEAREHGLPQRRGAMERENDLVNFALSETAALRDAEARTWREHAATLQAENERLEKILDDVMAERDRAQDVIQDTHVALGGDGEWCAKPGQTCAAGETGDMHIDVPAMAESLRAELATSQERCVVVEKINAELASDLEANNSWYEAAQLARAELAEARGRTRERHC